MTVTAIVVNYNSGGDLDACLTQLLVDKSHLTRVIVYDNASGDDSWLAAFDSDDTRVELIRSEYNLGLAAAVNVVLSDVKTPYIAILNPDVVVSDTWLEPLVETIQSDSAIAVVCPLILLADGGRINSAGQHLHITGLGFNRLQGETVDKINPGLVGNTAIGLHGAAFLIRRESLAAIGGWDESGFLYQEDVALSWDLLLMGLKIELVADSVVVHDYFLTMYPDKFFLLERNRWALLLSHLRLRWVLLFGPFLLLTEILTWGLALLRGPSFMSAKWRGYGWVWQNRDAVKAWKRKVMGRPVYNMSNLLRSLGWSYPLRQIVGLGAERGLSKRVPPGGLST
jgi:GT2 family glycosyltransferase